MPVLLTNNKGNLKFPGCGQFKIPPCSKRVVSENLH
jgi:hypothetical protein